MVLKSQRRASDEYFVSGHDLRRASLRENSRIWETRGAHRRSLGFARDDNFCLGTQSIVSKMNCHPDRSVPGFPATLHWTQPRMRLSVRERRMMCINATKFHRKSGGAEWRDLLCALRPSQILEFSRRLFSPTLVYGFAARLKSCPDTASRIWHHQDARYALKE